MALTELGACWTGWPASPKDQPPLSLAWIIRESGMHVFFWTWVLRGQAEVLILMWQAFDPLSHLPSLLPHTLSVENGSYLHHSLSRKGSHRTMEGVALIVQAVWQNSHGSVFGSENADLAGLTKSSVDSWLTSVHTISAWWLHQVPGERLRFSPDSE